MEGSPNQKRKAQRTAELADRRAEMWRMALAGHTQQEIADHYGVTQSAVSQQLRKANAERPARAVDEWRTLTLDKLDLLEQAVLEVMARQHEVVSVGKVVTRVDDDGVKRPVVDDGPVLAAVGKLLDISRHRLDVVPGLKAVSRVSVEAERLSADIAALIADAIGVDSDDSADAA